MSTIRAFIAHKQGALASHPLLRRLREGRSLEDLARLAPALAFWAMAYQDMLRLNERRMLDPELRKIARHHRAEDSGHDRWYLDDVQTLVGDAIDLRGVFSKPHMSTRDATYELMSELFRAQTDFERIVILLAVEAVGQLFLAATADCADRTAAEPLIYFSRQHIESERRHEVFAEHVGLKVDALDAQLGASERRICEAAVERIFAALWGMLEGLATAVGRGDVPVARPPSASYRVHLPT